MKVNIHIVIWCPIEQNDLVYQPQNCHMTQKIKNKHISIVESNKYRCVKY